MRTQYLKSSSGSGREEVPSSSVHVPVLLHEVIEELAPEPTNVVFDGTLGGAGHGRVILERLSEKGLYVATDLDADALERAREYLAGSKAKTVLLRQNFSELEQITSRSGVQKFDRILLDLGWSSDQLEVSGRGFSLQRDEPLAMTLAQVHDHTGPTAIEIVNEWEEESLADIISGWGEERYAKRIARAIVLARDEGPIERTRQLSDIIRGAVPLVYSRRKIHPATKTFQALRIAVNNELGVLDTFLNDCLQYVAPGGRISIISFHSLEDRIVKRRFKEWKAAEVGEQLNKKPTTASDEELRENPRARSAKLRTFVLYEENA